MNVPFCLWLAWGQTGRYQIMFHEVAYPYEANQAWRRDVLAGVTHWMAGVLARNAKRIFVSSHSWATMIRRITSGAPDIEYMPIPSNVATVCSPQRTAALRQRYAAADDCQIVGHFGTYGTHISPMLTATLVGLLTDHPRPISVLLLGRDGQRFAAEFTAAHPRFAARITAFGQLSSQDTADHLSACDLLLQPYPDGVTTRRGSLMAGLALGLPIVTTDGHLTEPLWRQSSAVSLVAVRPADEMVQVALRLLGDDQERAQLAARARDFYLENFAIENTIAVLCGTERPAAPHHAA